MKAKRGQRVLKPSETFAGRQCLAWVWSRFCFGHDCASCSCVTKPVTLLADERRAPSPEFHWVRVSTGHGLVHKLSRAMCDAISTSSPSTRLHHHRLLSSLWSHTSQSSSPSPQLTIPSREVANNTGIQINTRQESRSVRQLNDATMCS